MITVIADSLSQVPTESTDYQPWDASRAVCPLHFSFQFYQAYVESSTSEEIIILSTTKHPSPPRIIRLQSLQASLPCIQLLLINWSFGSMWRVLLGCSGCSYNRIRRSSILILRVFTQCFRRSRGRYRCCCQRCVLTENGIGLAHI